MGLPANPRSDKENTVDIVANDFELHLSLKPEKSKALFYDYGAKADTGWVWNGPMGWAPYISQTRQETIGEITIDGKTTALSGKAWLDRQWIKSLFAISFQWRWFAIQDIGAGEDLMIYEIFDPFTKIVFKRYGAIVDSVGLVTALNPTDFEITPLKFDTAEGRPFETSWTIELKSPYDRFYTFEYSPTDPWTEMDFGVFKSQFTEAPLLAKDRSGKLIDGINGWGEQVSSLWASPF